MGLSIAQVTAVTSKPTKPLVTQRIIIVELSGYALDLLREDAEFILEPAHAKQIEPPSILELGPFSGRLKPETLRKIDGEYSLRRVRSGNGRHARGLGILLLACTLSFALAGCEGARRNPEAKILFTQVPERNRGNQNKQDVMEGTVSGARQGQRLVIYSKSGGLWWLQPLLTSPFTPILPDGVWRNETHLGSDYAVLLVDPGYHPAAVLDRVPEPQKGIAAVAVSPGQERSLSYFADFSGFTWRVRKMPSDRGGTTNPYNPENVFVDQKGALHLRIIKRDQQWSCSEVNLTRSLGYGTYSITVEDISKLEPGAVFGIFTWDYSTDQENHGEFDINISQWGDPQDENAEFVLQPSLFPNNFSRFEAPAGKLKHTIVWEPGRITMITSHASGPRDTSVVSRHVFESEVPTPGVESLRMTFFAYRKPNEQSSRLHHPAEVVVDRFEYLP